MVGGAVLAAALAVAVVALLPRVSPDLAPEGTSVASAATGEPLQSSAAPLPDPVPQATPAAPQDGPRVDTFLLGPDGVAVVAGKATPGARVTILLDGAPLTEALADGSGGFAATTQIAASDLPRSLTFAENDEAASGEAVLVRPGAGSPPPDNVVAMATTSDATPTPGKTGAPETATVGTGADADAVASGQTDAEGKGTRETGIAPADEAAAEGTATALADGAAAVDASTAPVDGNDGASIALSEGVQSAGTGMELTAVGSVGTAAAAEAMTAEAVAGVPETGSAPQIMTKAPATTAPTIVVDAAGARVLGQGPQVMDRVALDAITYDTTGEVQLAGRAPTDGTLQVYIDNRPVTTAPVNTGGDWRVTLPQIDAGTYTLRIDALDAQGQVASRVETPFRRETPETVQAATDAGAAMGALTQTVQPGSTLWAIARDHLGEGMLYVAVFNANADQIRDPDLIYPGQVFVIPDRVPDR